MKASGECIVIIDNSICKSLHSVQRTAGCRGHTGTAEAPQQVRLNPCESILSLTVDSGDACAQMKKITLGIQYSYSLR